MSNKRDPGKPQLWRCAANIYFTSSRLSTQPNLSLHNGFLSHASMYGLLWLCMNGWRQAKLEVLHPASVTVWPSSTLGAKGAEMLLIWVTVLLGRGLRSSRNRYECECTESVHVGLVKLHSLSVFQLCVFPVLS